MSIDYPQTLAEWEDNISQYHGAKLLTLVRTANKMTFIQTLLEEGMVMADVNELFAMFVRRMCGLGLPVPADGLLDLPDIARQDPVCQMGEVLEITDPNPVNPPDELDLMFQELDSQADPFMEVED